MILLIDNYDSFVHNLARYVGELGYTRRIVRNNAISIDEIRALSPQAVILSPGPCGPDQAGISLELVRRLAPDIPILGVCLGHQVIAQAFGGTVRRARQPRHGKASRVHHDGTGLFTGLPDPFVAGRYHSLAVDVAPGAPLRVTACAEDGEIMALSHSSFPVYGVQFHPESVLTEGGHALLGNFLRLADSWNYDHTGDAA
ncbi:MAG: aminodeoxychorismate/anthranilate synthase component II [Alphaproteobacteria bacterium]|nr:aminodeoxychorismate/anthranilate synthase component II [Alphaproteobacteria bacterium]